jgi:hypothetical protein
VGTCAVSKCVFCSINQPMSVSVHCNLLQEYSGYCKNHREDSRKTDYLCFD